MGDLEWGTPNSETHCWPKQKGEKHQTGKPTQFRQNLRVIRTVAASMGVCKDNNSLCNPESDSCFDSPHLLCNRLIHVYICYKGTFNGKLYELISLLENKWKEIEPKLTVRFGMILRSLYCIWVSAITVRAIITGIVTLQMMNYSPNQSPI